ncbi:hypothetical protein [Poseidonocella sedimentorum]|nr:hypothetical protein [Poseidonocella sedimentorum]
MGQIMRAAQQFAQGGRVALRGALQVVSNMAALRRVGLARLL